MYKVSLLVIFGCEILLFVRVSNVWYLWVYSSFISCPSIGQVPSLGCISLVQRVLINSILWLYQLNMSQFLFNRCLYQLIQRNENLNKFPKSFTISKFLDSQMVLKNSLYITHLFSKTLKQWYNVSKDKFARHYPNILNYGIMIAKLRLPNIVLQVLIL